MKADGAGEDPQPRSKKGIYTDESGHTVLDGARWHYPRTGHPTECAIEGCERILGQQPRPGSILDDLDDPDDLDTTSDADEPDPADAS